MSDRDLVTTEIAEPCRNSPRYFPQLVCSLPRGHEGNHKDCEYTWEDR